MYVVSAEALYDEHGNPRRGTYYTKIGMTGNLLVRGSGRQQTAEFWLQTFGLGGIKVHFQEFHEQAFYIEKQVHAHLNLRDLKNQCGKSRESFNINPEEAVAIVRKYMGL
ncbi:GIY-YIG nuclease family protein [Sphingomonas pseudosanguinis]|uniref:Bacteriophage T5 Orf172 DNA-binding domain-containing protein n=1 Tax=Sphingomonas pseudosanguinis TaxID=413712 RepID=A0A7W6AF72_9SPHN|nr:hypothetical protein [Sphingomonas pseudosanguinis]MBN3535375.1 GIY-YIG nuclease family protein [Sphingomonas pseudosanguinis]